MPVSFLAIDGSIATVTLDHPSGNRINFAMREELLALFRRVAQSDARVLLIRAEGRDFSLGGDIRDWVDISAEELRPRIEVYAEALDHLDRLAIPTVAAVQGRCLGGGLELVLSCDLVIAAKSAQFGCPEALLGIPTLQGGVFQLAQRIGRTRAAEFVFLSDLYAAETMERLNLVNRVVADDELEDAAGALVDRLASGAPQAYAITKTLLRAWAAGGLSGAKSVLYDIAMPLFDTNDVRAALRKAAGAASQDRLFPMTRFGGDSHPSGLEMEKEQERDLP
jgi:enoyl-CoA hydratase/carnithine racemase